ncbi:MAG: chorismate mutase [Deltaproteobacteria bacterium GWC2_42_11]|nr:MAG: chorismate mutase [Deltaproteobacteria bacterium GWC2_42_11]
MSDNSKKLKELRQEIDRIDDSILELLNNRAKLAIEIGSIKKEGNHAIYVPEREREIYQRLLNNNPGPFPNNAVKNVFREIMSTSISLEKTFKIAFLGPKATFTHMACLQHFGMSAELIPAKEIADVFDEVERDRVDYGVVPIENTTEGAVSHTLDMFVSSNLKISAEIMLEISLALLNRTGSISDVKKVYSHPHAIAECREWLKNNLPNAALIETSSTAVAAQTVVDDHDAAAIASEKSAELYDLKIVERKIEDHLNNFTRFLVIGKTSPKKTGNDKTSILFSVKDSPGILFRMLKPFAERGINLTKIESRPQKKKAWEYIFFLDVDGHISDKKVSDALKEMEGFCSFMKILGSYPKGEK